MKNRLLKKKVKSLPDKDLYAVLAYSENKREVFHAEKEFDKRIYPNKTNTDG